jgi:hypothetical protein
MFRPPKTTAPKEEEKKLVDTNSSAKEPLTISAAKQLEVTKGSTGPRVTSPRVISDTRTDMPVQPEREDITSKGGTVSPNNAGVEIVAPVAGKKVKVYDAGYEVGAAGLHYFYFGTSTTATTKRFMVASTTGTRYKTFVQPRIGAEGDGLYLFSAVAETNMPYDVGYVQE